MPPQCSRVRLLASDLDDEHILCHNTTSNSRLPENSSKKTPKVRGTSWHSKARCLRFPKLRPLPRATRGGSPNIVVAAEASPPIVTDTGMALAGCGCVLHLRTTGSRRMRWEQSRLHVKDLAPNVSHETVQRGNNTFESKAVQYKLQCLVF